MSNDFLLSPPAYFRAGKAAGVLGTVDRTGGKRRAGIIRGVSVITKGEALGHDLWIDDTFLESVADAINKPNQGIKSRFAHPSMSGDGLGKFTGRIRDAEVAGDKVIADQHFSEAGHSTPDGDLAGYLMDLAESDPDAYGLSIVFSSDLDAEEAFRADNPISPDRGNTRNLPHARLRELRAADAVDEPAANPEGLFSVGGLPSDADSLAAFALGLSDELPESKSLGVDPQRIRGFCARFLDSHNLEIKSMADNLPTTDPEETPVPEPVEQATPAPAEEAPQEAPAEEAPQAVACHSGQDYLDAFGDLGGVWFAKGMSWDEATKQNTESLKKRIEELEKKLSAGAVDGEDSPVEFDEGETVPKRAGFASKIRIAGN